MRITCGWRLTGTDTLRLASGKMFSQFGTNLQNPNDYLMESCIPDEGKSFIQFDQSGAEALVVAHEAPPGRMLKLFECGIKPHTYTALQLYMDVMARDEIEKRVLTRIEPADLKAYPRWPDLKRLIEDESPVEYAVGKTTRHARNYDMKAPTFILNVLHRSGGRIVLSLAEGKRILAVDDETFPELLQWHEEVKAKAFKTRTLKNLFGFPRYFGGRWDAALERKLYAFVPQSTVGTITNFAFVEAQDYIEEHNRDWDVLNNKHDSIMLQVPDAEVEEAITIIRPMIERELTSSRGVTYRMRSGVAVGKNWAKWSKENPLGMKERK